MKLLTDERKNLEDGEIKLTMRPITTALQARMVELASEPGLSSRVALADYCLRNCVEKIAVGDVAYDPIKLAKSADISDEGTLSVLILVGEMVTKEAFSRGGHARNL